MTDTFRLTVAMGSSGGRPPRWTDVQEWVIDVSQSDTLATLIEKTRAAGGRMVPTDPSQLHIAPTCATSAVSDHRPLPNPRLDATIAENALTAGNVLRFWDGSYD